MGTNITGIGNANAIGFKSRVTGGMYFPPELKDALVGVWSAYGKSNDSTDRNIIKNKIKDRGGDFELINFNYEGTSGYNGYPVIFGKDRTYQYINYSPNYNQTTINVTHFNTRQALLYSYVQQNGELTSYNRDYPSYKIKVSGLEESFGLRYQYNSKANATSISALRIEANGIYTIPKSFASDGSLTNANIWVGFVFTGTEQEQCNVTIEVLPEYKGAVVTDGVDDMIVSTKTVSEMLEGSNEVTVISMIHQIKNSPDSITRNNWMFQSEYYLENRVSDESIGKSGIYGYTSSNISGAQVSVINNILGDKNDYTGNSKIESTSLDYFSVEGFRHSDGNMWYLSQVAWYWTFIAKRVLTEDEINLIIEKYNLDRPGEIVKPDVYYDIKRQKITNENHSSFDDELTDFSGNGHNMKLYNIAWEGNSGIGNYPVIFGANKTWEYMPTYNFIYSNSGSKIHITKVLHAGNGMLFSYAKINDVLQNIKEIPSFKVKVSGLEGNSTLRYSYIKTEDAKYQTLFDLNNGVHEVPKSLVPTDAVVNNTWIGFTIMPIYEEVREFDCDITIEVIPSDENTICLDGVDDYGKVTGLPIYKDYTVAALRKWLYDDSVTSTQTGSIVSKSKFGSDGAFIFEQTLNKNPSRSSTWCFGLTNSLINNDKLFEESFTYQTKYSYNNNPIQPGTGFDRDSMWLGSVRDNDSRYSKMAIWSLLLFPYSLSEFLLERQIKKARAGTLYPNQVEFRPIIPEDENITRIDYFVVNSGTWTVIKPGDYVDVGARIVFNVYTKLPYKVEKVSSPAFTGMNVRHSTELNIFDVEGYIKDKTPQKIKLTLAVNEDIVQWNPTITSNLLDSFTASSWYLNGWDNTLTVGTWIKKTDRVFFKATFKTELYGLETATFGGAECVVSKADNWSDSKNIWDIRMLGTVGDLSQVFNLDVYELIRFEDIIQPYPVLLRFKDENNNVISWGDKIKLGSSITRIDSFNDCNLLKDIYTVSNAKLNGNPLPSTPHVVERQMVFTCTATWILDDNEPNCILSPDRLQIPNSSYRILGYIPDISGHGNHGKINNSAYAGMSGVNGYPYDYKNGFMAYSNCRLVDSETFNVIFISPTVNIIKNTPTYKGKIKVIGLSGYLKLRIYPKDDSTNAIEILEDGVYDINIDNETDNVYFHVVKIKEGSNDINVIIQQVGEYEGAFYLDGVDDFVTIPTTVGSKQVLMKVNWQKENVVLYDQRTSPDGDFTFAIHSSDSNVAYNRLNKGSTYIDGILNTSIIGKQLQNVNHNIVITNNLVNHQNSKSPIIGKAVSNTLFAQMALYDFMLFDEISTDEEIKELNNIVGIEGDYVQKPSYYWDAYGKTNTDADRDEIVNLASDEVSIQYPTDFTDTSVWEDMGAVTSSTILTLTTWAMGGDTGIGNTIKAKVATPAMKVKFITDGNGYLDYMYSGYNTLELPRDAGEYEVELPASTIVDGWGARFSSSGNGSFTIELLGNEVRLGTLKVINSAYDEDSGYGGAGLIVKFSKDYHDNGFWKFVENRSEFNVLNNGDSVNIINAKSVEALFYMAPTTKKAFYKVTGVSTGKGIKFGTDNVSPWEGVIAEKDGIYEVDWSLNVHTGTGDLLAPCILSNGWLGDCNIVIEQVKQYPNGIALDGVDDSLVNTDIPTFTDFTVIAKRTWLEENTSDKPFIIKGDTLYPDGNQNAFLFEYGKLSTYSFGQNNKYDESVVPSLISWATPTSYNGTTSLVRGSAIDTIGIDIAHATKMVFYKLFLYPRTIDMLSINMVKNMMEEDGIIDLTSKLFTDKYTGDFYEMDFNNDFFIGD